MKIYTILGASNGIRVDENEQKQILKARYKFSQNFEIKSLKREKYINMFSLLLDNKEHFNANEVVAIYTNLAQKKQKEMLEVEFDESFKYKFDENYLIENENNFYEVLRVLNKVTQATQEESILDLTHGFRHLPILATISLISQNFQNNKNIKHILFAKELKKDEYEIIDLKEYLEIANLSIILENFSDNYTISSNVTFENMAFQEIADNLRLISNHILANSFKKIYDDSTLTKLIKSLKTLELDEKLSSFNFQDILSHIKEIKELENKQEYKKFFELSKMLSDKGYLLNAITLLYEASSLYCAFMIEKISPNLKNHIESYLSLERASIYDLSNDSRRIILYDKTTRGKNFHPYLYNPQREGKSKSYIDNQKEKGNKLIEISNNIKNEIYNFLDNRGDLTKFRDFLSSIKTLRDNLAHANSSETIENAKQELKIAQDNFYIFCIKDNILRA